MAFQAVLKLKNTDTPLHLASLGRLDLVTRLNSKGANDSEPHKKGDTPILEAVKKGYKDVAEMLINRGDDINEPDIVFIIIIFNIIIV